MRGFGFSRSRVGVIKPVFEPSNSLRLVMEKTWQMNRRAFLKGAGVTMALPFLEAMLPGSLSAAASERPRRLVCVGNPYGMIPERFFPEAVGLDYPMPVLLQPMEKHRRDFTIFSNFDHGVSGGHRVVDTFLTGVKTSDAKAMPDGNISIDQRAAEFVGTQTRFPSLNLGVGGNCEMCWTRAGVNVPTIDSSREVFRRLFVDDSPQEKQARGHRNDLQGSILDAVNEHAKALNRKLGKSDQEKLDEYLTSVRGVEKRLEMSDHWLTEPKPQVRMKEPEDGSFVESLGTFYDLMTLALKTDSTRIATLEMPVGFNTQDLGLRNSYHGYSHHGKDPENLKVLTVIEKFQMTEFSRFLDQLKTTEMPGGGTLFDDTMVLFGSGMGNGSSHSNKDLPILLAGGGFRHKGHVALPAAKADRVPLSNLYVTMLQRFGLEVDTFGTSKSTFDLLG